MHVCIHVGAHVLGGCSIHTGLPRRIFHKKRRDVFIHTCFIPSNARVCSGIFIAHIAYVDLTAICWEQKANATCKPQFQLWHCAFRLHKQLTELVLIKLFSFLLPYFGDVPNCSRGSQVFVHCVVTPLTRAQH